MVDRHVRMLQEKAEQALGENVSDNKIRRVMFIIPVLDILKDIEGIPLKIDEMRYLRGGIAEHFQKHDLQSDKDLLRIVSRRFSLAYLPGISSSGVNDYMAALDRAGYAPLLEKYSTKWIEKTTVDISSARQMDSPKSPNDGNSSIPAQISQQEAHILLERRLSMNSKNKKYYICSFRRHQSALWTSYRLYLDGVKELNSAGEVVNTVQLTHSIMLLGAKKLKSGISAQCFVWKTEDSKNWKEKTAIGKVTRNANIYIGIPFLTHLSSSSSSLSHNMQHDVNSENAMSESSSSVPTSSSITAAQVAENGDVKRKEVSSAEVHEKIDSNTSTEVPLMTRLFNKDLLEGGPVSISVQSKGPEKLIQLTIALQKQQANSPDTSQQSLYATNNELLLADLEQLVRNPLAFSSSTTNSSSAGATAASAGADGSANSGAFEPLPYIVLRSKIPRRLNENAYLDSNINNHAGNQQEAPNNTSQQSQFGVTFGRNTRIRFASRKNLAADVWIDFQSNQKRVAVNNDWSTDAVDVIPLLQVGKMEEDRFAVDFHTLSPFQAFSIAVAIFDQ